jgi:hypothetical protein
MHHGARSERRWRPIADRLAAELVEVAPWVARPTFAATVAAWARVEAQLALVGEWLDEHGILDEHGSPRPTLGTQDRLETRAITLRGELGLSPQSLARLLRTTSELAVAHSEDVLEALRAEGRKLLEAHERRVAAANGRGDGPDSYGEPSVLSSGSGCADDGSRGSQGDAAVTTSGTDTEERDT